MYIYGGKHYMVLLYMASIHYTAPLFNYLILQMKYLNATRTLLVPSSVKKAQLYSTNTFNTNTFCPNTSILITLKLLD